VKKEYQGRGLARELLELPIAKCGQAGNIIDEVDVR
jgi:hypothetical protein